MNNRRGFFTIAFGKQYQKIAYNLLLSARFNKLKYPFAIVSDCSNKYTKAFDKEIIVKPLGVGFFNKLYIDKYAPYEESIFIEADTLIFNDISRYFDLLKNNGDERISFGKNFFNADKLQITHPPLYNLKKAKKEGVNFVFEFDGSIYFYSKIGKSRNVFKVARDLYKKKVNYDFPFYGDEPFIALAAAKENIKCQDCLDPIINFNHYNIHDIKMDIVSHKLILNQTKNFGIAHWSTQKTYGTYYKETVGVLKYYRTPLIILYKSGIYGFISRTINFFKSFFK